MIIERITEAVVYETPDGGQTVYVRKSGEVHRQLHSESKEKKDLLRSLEEDKLWGEIRRAAKNNPTLQGILDQAIMVYKLIDTK
jgi:hypothetical protein